MLKLAELVPGFYRLPDKDLGIPIVSPAGSNLTWKPGLSVVGITSASRLLTDGTPSAGYNGISVPGKGEKDFECPDGWVVKELSDLQKLAFVSPEIEIIALGAAAKQSYVSTGTWTRFAVRQADLLPSSEKLETGKYLRCSAKTLFDALREKPFACGYSLDQFDMATFRPSTPLSRETWRKLGFWIYTKAKATQLAVCPIEKAPNCILVLPFPNMEAIWNSGFSKGMVPSAADPDSGTLAFMSVSVHDPLKAAGIWPLARLFASGHGILKRLSGEVATVKGEENLCHLAAMAENFYLKRDSVLASPKAFRTDGKGIVLGIRTDRFQETDNFAFATKELADQLLVSVKKAASSHTILASVPRYTVYADGEELPGKYIFATDLAKLPARSTTVNARRQRLAALTEKYGSKVPDDWENYSEADFAKLDIYRARQADGWKTAEGVAEMFDLPSGDLGLTKDIEDWLCGNYEPVKCRCGYDIFAVLSTEQILAHPEMPSFFRAVFKDRTRFATLCLFSDAVRVAMLADSIAK